MNAVLWESGLKLKGEGNEQTNMCNNKTLMQCAVEYDHQTHQATETLKHINFVHLKKNMWLLCKLVGCKGRAQTSCCVNMQENSSLQWQFMQDITELVTRKKMHMWNDFLKWLIAKPMITNIDFKPNAWRCKISVDRKWFTMRDDKWDIKSCVISNDGKHCEIDEVLDQIDLRGIIGRLDRKMTSNACGIQS